MDINTKQITKAAEAINSNKLVVFPTETVYGIGANALNAEAVSKIFVAKRRPADNPLIIHIADKGKLRDLLSRDLKKIEQDLIDTFWPGPLTLILPKSEIVPDATTAGLETLAVRMPNHHLALALIDAAGIPIAAPSANISGKPSPTSDKSLDPELLASVEEVIVDGKTKHGLESTVVLVKNNVINILRPGAVSAEELEVIAPVIYPKSEVSISESPISPGNKYRHYAPEKQLLLFEYDEANKFIDDMQIYLRSNQASKIGVICAEEYMYQFPEAGRVINLGKIRSLPTIASSLFEILNSLDEFHQEFFLIHGVPEQGIGKAIMNRMRKAASPNS